MDGNFKGSLNMSGELGSNVVYIGKGSYSFLHWQGYIDEVRIVNGESLYNSNFNPYENIPAPSIPEPDNLLLLFITIIFMLVYHKI